MCWTSAHEMITKTPLKHIQLTEQILQHKFSVESDACYKIHCNALTEIQPGERYKCNQDCSRDLLIQ